MDSVFRDVKPRYLLLYGSSKSGKTSLLFQHSLRLAERNKRILFVSPTKIDCLPLKNLSKPQPSMASLSKIKIIYPESPADLIRHFTTLHTHPKVTLPHSIIIDDIDDFVSSLHGHEKVSTLAKIISIAIDTAEFVSKSLADDDQCSILTVSVSSSLDGSGHFLSFYGRWFSVVLRTKKDNDEEMTYELSWSNPSDESSIYERVAGKYRIGKDYIEWL